MKVLFTADLHGRRNLFKEMTELALKESVQCIILGGDILPTLIPSPLALINGNADFQEDLKGQFSFVEDYLAPVLTSFLSSNPGINIIYIPGNHGWIPAVDRLVNSVPQLVYIHGRTIHLDDIAYFGYACVPDSTFWVKDYARRDRKNDPFVPSKFAIVSDTDRLRVSPDGEYATKNPSIEEDLSGVSFDNPGKTICVFHCPPYDSGLDTLHNNKPIGSRAISDFIERTQPKMSLHGHIHESPYMSGIYQTRIGNCLSINPGQSPSRLHAVIFDTHDPAETMIHTVFGYTMPQEVIHKRRPERFIRKIKAYFMDTVLRG